MLHVLVPEDSIRTETSPRFQVEMSYFFQTSYLALHCCTSIAKMEKKKFLSMLATIAFAA